MTKGELVRTLDDLDMGELMDTLRELGIAQNTLIVFSGDNGLRWL